MRKLLLGLAALTAIPANAVTLDNFDTYNPASPTFSSSYFYTAPTAGGNTAAQQYTVAPNAFPWNSNFASYGDTTGGNFMVVNGGGANTLVWQNNTPVFLASGGRYVFSFDLSRACCNGNFNGGVDPSPAVLAVTVNGVTTLTALTPPTSAGVWGNVRGEFTAAAESTATFAIINSNPEPGGNDYGLDRITLSVPEPAAWALMISGFGLVGGTMRRRRRTAAFA